MLITASIMNRKKNCTEDCYDRRPAFGNRLLTDEAAVFTHNAWDRVDWSEEQLRDALAKVRDNSSVFLPPEVAQEHLSNAVHYWDKFYEIHKDKFFKDRHWLFTEFPELLNDNQRVLEVGCGVGNTVLPLLLSNETKTFVHCCDFSAKAISILKKNPLYDESRCNAFVCDITQDNLVFPFEENSIDIIVMIFVLSAIRPSKMFPTLRNLVKYLKPGGLLLFRDYGRFDMTQLRFKKGHCIESNLYIRGDGTMAYFFSPEEVCELMRGANLRQISLFVDRRLQVNRGKQLKMYRHWIQAKYEKIECS